MEKDPKIARIERFVRESRRGGLGCICQSFRVSVTEQSMKGGAEIYKPPTILNCFRANQACLTRTRNAWAAQKKKKKNVSDRL